MELTSKERGALVEFVCPGSSCGTCHVLHMCHTGNNTIDDSKLLDALWFGIERDQRNGICVKNSIRVFCASHNIRFGDELK